MTTVLRQGSMFKDWLKKINQFDHANTLSVEAQRLATRIYLFSLTITVSGLFIYIFLSAQQYTVTIESPSAEDFIKLQLLQFAKISCPCETITIPYETFITLEPVFHPVCSSEFVRKEWSDAFFYENASMYLPVDIRSTLSAQYQLLSSLCILAQQTIDDELRRFRTAEFVSTQVIQNSSFQVQIDALVSAFQSNASSSLLRGLSLIRQTTFANQFVSGVSSNSALFFLRSSPRPYVAQATCDYRTATDVICDCYYSYACHAPVGLFTMTMPVRLLTGCELNVSINESFTIFNGLFAGCIPMESLLISTLACFYDKTCLDMFLQYAVTSINISSLSLSDHGQFTQNSTIMDILSQLFVHRWETNISYNAFFAVCSPTICSYTYTKSVRSVYIISTVLGLYGGLTVTLQFLILLAMKYGRLRNNRFFQFNHDISNAEKLQIILRKFKQIITEFNLFAEKEKLTIHQQRMTTQVFSFLFSSAIFTLIFFSMFSTQTYIKNIESPTRIDFERLHALYSNTLTCSCSQIIIPQKQFIQLSPNFHAVCSSIYISKEWFDALVESVSTGVPVYFLDFRLVASSNFAQLKSFCSLANQTIQNALGIFDNTPFISSQAVSASTLTVETNVLITTFQHLIEDIFTLQVQFIQNTSYGNQLLSSSFTNAIIHVEKSTVNDLKIKILSAGYQLSSITNCSCTLEPFSCASPTSIYGSQTKNTSNHDILVSVPNFFLGCFIIDSLFLSTLECFYHQSCLDQIQPYIPNFNMTVLTISPTSQYNFNTSIGKIIQQLLVEYWNISVSFENYYSACAPQLCTYSYEQRANFVFLLTTLVSLFGGLNVVLRIISPFFILIFFKRYRRNADNPSVSYRDRLYNLLIFLRTLPSQVWRSMIILNLFKRHGQQEDEQRTCLQLRSTRLYLCILISTLIVLAIYRTTTSYTFTENIDNPSLTTFARLHSQYTDMLVCPCNDVSIPHSQFVTIEFTFHPICSSNFITQTWFNGVFRISNAFPSFDFRTTALAHFQLLASLCGLANQTVNNARSSFLTNKFISTKLISSDVFFNQINSTTQLLELHTRSTYSQSLQLIRDTTTGNALLTVYTSSWQYVVNDQQLYSTIFTRPVTYNHENGTCSCGAYGDCSQLAAIYYDTETIQIPGFRVGCYPLNSVLQSTLECLYDQQCVDLLRNIFNISESFIALENKPTSHFSPNATIYSLANELLIEKWYTNISYENFFRTCAVSSCSYSYSEKPNFVYVITTLIGLYGGLTISLKILSPILISILNRLVERMMRLHINTVAPVNH